MWQKLRLYCACQWGEGERAGQGNTCPGHSRALSARGFSLIHEGSSTGIEGGKLLWDPTRVKLRSASLTQVVTQIPCSGAWVGLADPGRIYLGS